MTRAVDQAMEIFRESMVRPVESPSAGSLSEGDMESLERALGIPRSSVRTARIEPSGVLSLDVKIT